MMEFMFSPAWLPIVVLLASMATLMVLMSALYGILACGRVWLYIPWAACTVALAIPMIAGFIIGSVGTAELVYKAMVGEG
jgi:hypothetical protein